MNTKQISNNDIMFYQAFNACLSTCFFFFICRRYIITLRNYNNRVFAYRNTIVKNRKKKQVLSCAYTHWRGVSTWKCSAVFSFSIFHWYFYITWRHEGCPHALVKGVWSKECRATLSFLGSTWLTPFSWALYMTFKFRAPLAMTAIIIIM